MSSEAFKFLEELRRAGQSGSATFGSITAGRMAMRGPNMQVIRKPTPEGKAIRDAFPMPKLDLDFTDIEARIVSDFSNGGLP